MTPGPIVIKYGGSLLEEPGHRAAFLEDVAVLFKKQKVILVHGGGKEISRRMEEAGLKPRFVNGRRYTDDATMAVVKKALSHLNDEIVAELGKLGVPAFGRSGQEDHLMEAEVIKDLGRVGIPKRVNPKALDAVLSKKALPVFYSVAVGPSGETLNINADDFAQELAIACKAEHLIFMTDTGGILGKKKEIIELITPKEVEGLIADGTVAGGMAVKARACIDALSRGVHKVTIAHQVDSLGSSSAPRAFGTSFVPG